ncbi:hypothetical protein AVEN_175483-1 [Araneus ventricosus]|uniref:Uncharacterized protein n=1 Tax=Araneus ventricosus TaxID=182803 RepID=A0A4Y2U4W1_ARAVE|nr:hypothetical protein AVEN_175483-1 [Araneus ventricosus]
MSINVTKIKSVTKISQRPTDKKDFGEISVEKFSVHSTEIVKSKTRRYNEMAFAESKMKISKTKSLEIPNKNNVSVNAIEGSHFLHFEIILEEKGNEDLYIILHVNYQELGNKIFRIETESNISQKLSEDK